MNKILTEKELEEILNTWVDSEDELENESEDEMLRTEDVIMATRCGEVSDDINEEENVVDHLEVSAEKPAPPDTNPQPTPVRDINIELTQLKEKYKKVLWKFDNNFKFGTQQTEFTGNCSLPKAVLDLSTPLSYFNYFFSEDLIGTIVAETNLYSTEKNPDRPQAISATHIKKYVGICIMTSVVQVPNIRRYWSPIVGNIAIQNTMTVNEFEKIRRNLHFNTNSNMLPRDHPEHDRLHKIRPIINQLIKKNLTIPREECLSLDEQICATKARSYMKQYMPAKPHKWGYKLFVLSGVSGFTYNFEIYTGSTSIDELLQEEPYLGASANVVIRLTRCVEINIGHKVYFDNFYTTLPLVVELAKKGIYSVGTIRRNRLASCKLPSDKDIKKDPRGKSFECFANIDDIDVCSLCWKDNKVVNLLSTFVSAQPIEKIKRYDKTIKQRVEIDCPNIIKQYNKHMGGVDLADSLIGRYRIKMKSRKWYIRIFYHLVDITIVNSWILYKKVCLVREEIPMSLCDFRINLGESLCRSGVSLQKTRGRPSSSPGPFLQEKRKKCINSHIPSDDVRKDDISHWPVYINKRLRCKLPNCTGYTFIKCEKCDTALCFNKSKNCFKDFHN